MKFKRDILKLIRGFSFTVAFLTSSYAEAATISVDANCSLVDAINAANTDSGVNGCGAGNGADIITLQQDSIITLSVPNIGVVGLPYIKTDITIQGHGAIIQRDSHPATPVFRIFDIFFSGSLRLNDLTIRNGLSDTNTSGAGINNNGTLVLSGVVVTDNHAISENGTGGSGGGIHNNTSGTLNIENSIIQNNTAKNGGGGIVNRGNLNIVNSTLSGNSSAYIGGAIVNFFGKTVIIRHTTIANNTATLNGGGISNLGILTLSYSTVSGNHADAAGGGVVTQDKLTIINSTFSGNTAGSTGGALQARDSVVIVNSTISANAATTSGGGIQGVPGFLISNTIVSNNTMGDCWNTDVFQVNDTNWFSDDSCDGSASGDPLLGPLADNGGPTQTHALLNGSGAINSGNNTICTNAPVNNLDQRLETRPEPAGSNCDIGAFELQDVIAPPEELVFANGFE